MRASDDPKHRFKPKYLWMGLTGWEYNLLHVCTRCGGAKAVKLSQRNFDLFKKLKLYRGPFAGIPGEPLADEKCPGRKKRS